MLSGTIHSNQWQIQLPPTGLDMPGIRRRQVEGRVQQQPEWSVQLMESRRRLVNSTFPATRTLG